jgi:lipid-binding SYLF domain-containing protein
MRSVSYSFLLAAIILISQSWGQTTAEKRVQNSIGILQTTTEIPDSIMKNAQAFAVLPDVTRAGAGYTHLYGAGIMSVKRGDGCWSDPLFVSVSGNDVSWQAGRKSSDIILVFMNQNAVTKIEEGKFTLDQGATVGSGPTSNSPGSKNADIYVYTKSNGKFFNSVLSGSTMEVDSNANQNYYGNNKVTTQQITSGDIPNAPASASTFTKALGKMTGVCE